jgi:hypothetical protein
MWGQWISQLKQVMTGMRRWPAGPASDDQRLLQAQYHLGRGRRAREAGHSARGVQQAHRAIELNPRNPWAHALLGQCLMRTRPIDLGEARQALDRARLLDPTNGYFVRLSLELLHVQHDLRGRTELLSRAWWAGAPVERWLPGGPQPQTTPSLAPADRREPAAGRPRSATPATAGLHPVSA